MSEKTSLPRSARLSCALALSLAVTAGAARADEAEPDCERSLRQRRFDTRDGASGGLFLVDPSSGAVGSVRLQLMLDSFPDDDFLNDGDAVGQGRQALSVSFTPARQVEGYGALLGSGTSSEDPALGSLHAQSVVLGVKMFSDQKLAPFHVGGDARIVLHNELGGQLPELKATSVGVRAAGALDLRETSAELPLRLRLNLDYLLDNAALAAEDTEDARYQALDDARGRLDEVRHLLSRFERYALGLSRVDLLTLGFGVEAPIALGSDASIHPLLEWRMGLPINRRGFDCALPTTGAPGTKDSDFDSCLSEEGVSAWPSQLAIGVRVAPPVRGLSFGLAVDVGLTGTEHFVHELAPTSPLSVLLTLGYADESQGE